MKLDTVLYGYLIIGWIIIHKSSRMKEWSHDVTYVNQHTLDTYNRYLIYVNCDSWMKMWKKTNHRNQSTEKRFK